MIVDCALQATKPNPIQMGSLSTVAIESIDNGTGIHSQDSSDKVSVAIIIYNYIYML